MSALMCIGFGAINSQLVLYAPEILHFKTTKFFLLSSTYNALLFTLPLIGGYLAEKTGYIRTMLYGAALCTLGLLSLSFPSSHGLYTGLSLFSVGTCLFVPSYLVLQGKLYAKDDPRRESAFTLSYIIMNSGFLISGLFGGYATRYLGYQGMFILAAILLLLVYVLYFLGRKTMIPFAQRSIKAQLGFSKWVIWLIMVLASALLFICAYYLLSHPRDTTLILFSLIVIASFAITIVAIKQKSRLGKHRIYAFLILSYFSIAFWALYTLEPSLLTVFIRNNVNRTIWGNTIPTAAYYSLDAIFVILLGFLTSWVWKRLEEKGKDLSLPTKFSLALLIMGLGMLIIPLAIYFTGLEFKINMFWIVFVYVLLALAELFISPIGQAMVGRLSPEGMEGAFMGVWQLFTGFAGAFSVYLDRLAIIPKHLPFNMSNAIYSEAFFKIGSIALVVGIFSVLLIPYLKKRITSTN